MSPQTPRTDWVEKIAADEPERFERYARQIEDLQRKNARAGHIDRGLHAKMLVGCRAEFTVLPDLPAHARISLFAEPKTYPAWVRFSNGSSARQRDDKADVRGMAIKVVGVAGLKLISGLEDALTQDFLMIKSASISFRDAAEFMFFVSAAARPLTFLPRMIGFFGARRTLQIVRSLKATVGRKIQSLADQRFYSALPIQLGPYAVRYSVRPHASVSPPTQGASSADYLAEDLASRLEQGALAYDFMLQFYCDPERTPIEDASVPWREEDAPLLTVARLTLPQQVLRSSRGREQAAFVDRLSFDPWHATPALRPLGDIMRARRHAYRASTLQRSASREPDGSERFD